uniref:Ribonuclease n=1 Tax=Dunaliella tertiolecta TaxID=3047 RepID=A0A7S3QKU4_DUNTE
MRRSKRLRNQASSGGDSSVGQQQEEQQREEPEPATKRRKKQGRPPYNKGRPQRGKEPQPSNEEGEFLAPDEEPLRQGRAQANGRQSMQAQGKQKCKKDVGPTRQREEALWAKGYAAIGGLDEAGRGPLAGPVVAGICVLPKNPPESLLKGLNDSKLLNEAQRNDLYARITTSEGVLWAAQVIDSTTIDRINILQAALRAMREAAMQLPKGSFDYLLVDGNKVPEGLPAPAEAVVKGDATSSCIAAASVIAKVTRDRIMYELDAQYPAFNFRQHKGYGVPEHTAALRTHGPCAIHRRSFQPIRSMTSWTRAKQLAEEAAAAAEEKAAANPAAAPGDTAPAAASAAILQLEAA